MPDAHTPVSIIVTIYNIEPYLEQCLDSICSQSFPDIEVILVDDGSTDSSPAICDRYAADDKRFSVIHQENQGVSSARNRGIQSASGEYIMFVDGDDWLTPDAVEVLYINTARNSNCQIAAAAYFINFQTPFERERLVGDKSLLCKQYTYDLNSRRDDVIRFALTNTGIPELAAMSLNLRIPWAKLFRRSYLTDNDIYFIERLSKGEDRLFNLYAIKSAGELKVINIPVYHYRVRFDSLCHKFVNLESLSKPVAVWIHETRKLLDQCPNIEDDVYYKFLFFVLRSTSDFCFTGYVSGSQTCREAARNLGLLFNQELYRETIDTVNAHKHSKYFTVADRSSFNLFRFRRYAIYLRVRRFYFYRVSMR